MVLRLRTEPPDWHQAKCAGMVSGPHPENPKDWGAYDPWSYDEDAALEFCNGAPVCPVREQCLLFALMNNLSTGVWGGTTEVDRKALRKRWPLERKRNEDGETVWEMRPEWEWMPPGEASAGLDQDLLRKELEEELQSGG